MPIVAKTETQAFLLGAADVIKAAATQSVRDVGEKLKADLRSEVAAGLGARMGNSIRLREYPGGDRESMRAAAMVYANSPQVLEVFYEGGEIRSSREGGWLAIPTDNWSGQKRPGKKWGARSVISLAAQKYKDLRFVYLKKNFAFLVADVVSAKSGKGLRPATEARKRQKRKVETVPIFLLVPKVSMPKKINIGPHLDRALRAMPSAFSRAIKAALGGEK